MRLVVVGGGIAGLAAAHRALELARERDLGLDLALLEACGRLGGTIETERAGGYLVEAGPDAFLTEKPAALALCRRLGLEARLIGTDERFRRVWVWRAGRLHPVPEGFYLLAPARLRPFLTSRLFSWRGKARMALDLVLPRRPAGEDESLAAFVRRRLGREALERVAQPLAAGIYSADPEDLSLQATMPRFLELERTHRSLVLGLRRAGRAARAGETASGARFGLFASLTGGMGELIEALGARLPAGSVHLGRRVVEVAREAGGWRVRTEDGQAWEADQVVLAVEAHAAGRLLRYVDPPLATLLQVIPYASSVTIALGYRRADVPHPMDGFGFVVPRTEGRDLLACTFASVKFPGRAPDGHVLLRGFLGGALQPEVLERDDAELIARARRDLRDALGITAEPVLTRLRRHPAAHPQYAVGHLVTVEAIERRLAALPGLHLAGAAYRGVGVADCVRSGEAAAEAALAGPARFSPAAFVL
ncbi:MAG TPA: protoporphyrinogen oxidase [Candidatus Binatia bacterium]|nr:protoporphyrinogen oxidase [Candidatus Binatia bacterium]